MTDTNTGATLTDEQKTAAVAIAQNGGRTTTTEAMNDAARKAAAEKARVDPDQATIDAEKASTELAEAKAKETADADAKKKADEEAAANNKDWQKEWVSTGNEHADAAIELMKAGGMSPVEGNAVFEEAIKLNDLTKVKWDVLEARIGAAQTRLVKTGIEQYYNTEVKSQNEVKEFAYEQVGGQAGWEKVQAWAKKAEAADPKFAKDLNEWRDALSSGSTFAAKAAVRAIKEAYEGAAGNSSLNTKLERGNHNASQTNVGEPLSRNDYYKELVKAGGDRAPEHIKTSLRARRELGRSKGF